MHSKNIGVPLKGSIRVPLKGSIGAPLKGSIGAPLKVDPDTRNTHKGASTRSLKLFASGVSRASGRFGVKG